MGRSFLQFRLLLWKNFILRRRKPIRTAVEVLMPIAFIMIMVAVRQSTQKKDKQECVGGCQWPAFPAVLDENFPFSELPVPDIVTNCQDGYSLYYSPQDAAVASIVTAAVDFFDTPGWTTTVNSTGNITELEAALMDDPGKEGCKLGVVFDQYGEDGRYSYQLRFDATPGGYKTANEDSNAGGERSWSTDSAFPSFSGLGPRDRNQSTSAYGGSPGYLTYGFLFFQLAMNRAITQQLPAPDTAGVFTKEEATAALEKIWLQRMPYPEYKSDGFLFAIKFGLPMLLMLALLFTALNIVRNLVHEKERRLRESMKMMGLRNWIHWLSWFTMYLSFIVVSFAVCTILFKTGKVLKASEPTVIFVYLLLYGIASINFCFLISVFFTKASTGAAAGGIIWFCSYIPYLFVAPRYDTMSVNTKQAVCSLSTVAMSIGANIISEFEGRGEGVQWSNVREPISADDAFTFSTVLGSLLFDAILYAVLTWYIEAVFPGKYGVPRKPWFFLLPSYWCGSARRSNDPIYLSIKSESTTDDRFESDPTGLTAGISLEGLRKVFGSKVAVEGTNLRMYEDQITALLGHNGAGKTTTMSIITGLFPPTSGTAVVNGYDIATDISRVQESLGICPQHDVLFDTMTVAEHLWFFCRLKGVAGGDIPPAVEEMLEALRMPEKRNAQSRTLSGGMKRKLSCGIALVGGSKVVILDEPTSGMDPAARRATWDLLNQFKEGRTILLSTHFLDEADLLGDRIAIMSDGVVKCAGTSMFLKRKYGVGYHMVISKSNHSVSIGPITELVHKHIPEATVEGNVGSEVTYLLPRDASTAFPAMFEELESAKDELQLENYGVSVTTLEEVFLKVGEGTGEEDGANIDIQTRLDSRAMDALSRQRTGYGDAVSTNETDALLPSATSSPDRLSGLALTLQQFKAMIIKRMLHSRRDKYAIITQLLLPLVFTVFALVVAKTYPGYTDAPARSFANITATYGANNVMFTDRASSSADPSNVTEGLADVLNLLNISSTLAPLPVNANGTWANVSDYILTELDSSPGLLAEFNKRNLVALEFDPSGADVAPKAWFNGQAYHSPAEALALLSSVIVAAYDPSVSINTTNAPLPRNKLEQAQDRQDDQMGFYIAFNILFGMAFLASSFTLFLVTERSNKAKHIQFVSGVGVGSYWTATYLWDYINFLIPTFGCIMLFLGFAVDAYVGSRISNVILLFLQYGLSVLPLMYLFSYLFTTPSIAFVVMTMFNVVTGLAAMITISILEQTDPDTGKMLRNVFLILPNYCFGQGLSDLYENYKNIELLTDSSQICKYLGYNNITSCCANGLSGGGYDIVCNPDYLGTTNLGIGLYLISLAISTVVLFLAVMAVELRLPRRLLSMFGALFASGDDEAITKSSLTLEDEDVTAERRRVQELVADGGNNYGYTSKQSLLLRDLTKVYPASGCFSRKAPKVAVGGLTLAVPRGECFGLLGVNGAGKTTTFSMLTGEVPMTRGVASIAGHDVASDMENARRLIGYCPQFDGLIELMTGYELLAMYARLRGVPEKDIKGTVNDLVEGLMLEKHAHKKCGAYSGGNKRKLSTAVALVGQPPIVFLDEPTTGMDPGARRFLWDALMRVMDSGRSIILTSHSMEECEALCTRLAIMVNGRFQCLGSLQHLKSRFGSGLTVILKVTDEPAATKAFMTERFAGCVLKDEHQGILQYDVPSGQSWAKVFALLQEAKTTCNLIDYSVSQTTLEQVFLDFAKHQFEDERA